MKTILSVLLVAVSALALDDMTTPNTYTSNQVLTAAQLNEDNDSVRVPYNKLLDTLDAAFIRFSDIEDGDTTLDSMKASVASIDTLIVNTEMDSIHVNVGRIDTLKDSLISTSGINATGFVASGNVAATGTITAAGATFTSNIGNQNDYDVIKVTHATPGYHAGIEFSEHGGGNSMSLFFNQSTSSLDVYYPDGPDPDGIIFSLLPTGRLSVDSLTAPQVSGDMNVADSLSAARITTTGDVAVGGNLSAIACTVTSNAGNANDYDVISVTHATPGYHAGIQFTEYGGGDYMSIYYNGSTDELDIYDPDEGGPVVSVTKTGTVESDAIKIGGGAVIDSLNIVDAAQDTLCISVGAKTWKFVPVANQ